MAFSLTEAQAQLTAWAQASLAVSQNQSYEIDGRKLTRADAGEIRKMLEFWEGRVRTARRAAGGRRRTTLAAPSC